MMIELKPEDAASLARLLNEHAAQVRVEIASRMAGVERIEAIAGKVSDGGRGLDDTEIRLLADFVSRIQDVPDILLGMRPDVAQELFANLRSQLNAAKAKLNH